MRNWELWPNAIIGNVFYISFIYLFYILSLYLFYILSLYLFPYLHNRSNLYYLFSLFLISLFRYIAAPIALFYLDSSTHALTPIGIQLYPEHEMDEKRRRYPFWMPKKADYDPKEDHPAWILAKLWYWFLFLFLFLLYLYLSR